MTKEELKKHKFISFVEDHYNPLNIIRSLGEEGIDPIVILIGEHPSMINHCKYVGKLHRVSTCEEGYKLLLSEYGKEDLKPFIFCSDDNSTSFLDKHYEELKDSFFFYNAGEQGRITWLQNKDNITNLGSEAGLCCPPKEIVDTGVLPKTLKYPIITKVLASTMGAWKGDVYICNNEKELSEAYKVIQSPKLCLQEYIHKKGEFCMEGFSINDGRDIFMPFVADYIRFYDNSYGHYMVMKPFVDDELGDKIKNLLRRTKYNGIFEIEFMKGPQGEKYFLEINFRASTWAYALTVGGCNLPYFWAKSTLAGRILYEEMNIRDTPFKAMVDYDDFKNNVLKGSLPLKQWIKEFKGCECHYQYNKEDPKPFRSYIRAEIWRMIKKFIFRIR